MRNRPDSRGRLAGLTPARSPWPSPGSDVSADGDLRADDPPAVRRETTEPRHGGGWVPDVGTPLVARRVAQAGDLPAPPRGRAAPLHRRLLLPDDDVEQIDEVERPGDTDPDQAPDGFPDDRAARGGYRPHRAWGRVAQRWVPEPLREARVDPGRRGALLLTVVAAVAALVAAVGVWRDQPEARPVQAVSLAQVSDGPPTTGTATTTGRTSPLRAATSGRTTTGDGGSSDGSPVVAGGPASGRATTVSGAEVLIVSVTGAVRHPGLVRLPPGSRVADAIAKAGGVSGAADLTGVNLAARLTDGSSVVVSDQTNGSGSSVSGLGSDAGGSGALGSRGSTATARAGQPAGKVDLNTADAAALDALPGVGPVTAAAIVAWRDKNGRYTSVEQLQEIQGIGPAKYASLAPLVTV